MDEQHYQQRLEQFESEGRRRHLRAVEPLGGGMRCRVDGREVVNFSGNDYLGLSQDERLKDAARQATERYGTGSGGSRLISGNHPLFAALEKKLAAFKHTEAALVFNSGYQANISVLQAIAGAGDYIFSDRLNHASLLDGCRLSGAKFRRYKHLDYARLESMLAKTPRDAVKWIVSDSVFSMDGDCADLDVICDLAERYHAFTLIDEAHATGIFGGTNRSGLCEAHGVSQRVTLQMGTFSKALGGFGAYITGSETMIDYLANTARGFIYSTALPPGVVAANHKAVALVQAEPALQKRLWENTRLFDELSGNMAGLTASPTPIKPVIVKDSDKALRLSAALLEAGFLVQAIRPPTVPENTARLRITLSAAHQPEDIKTLVQTLESFLKN